ncbi:MAG: AMMECR1 domain-containing protein [Candidatus Aminicenantes bacterium]|nr:MAG: AMMECR1 domain-containing protein [Candidatus Aminicenantes bacterium]
MHPLVRLAKLAVEKYIKEKEVISPPSDLPREFLEKKAGVFVTIEKNGNLRACIGTYLSTRESIAEETIRNAIAAATEDWRFGPIQKEELPFLSYIVYILSPPEPVKEIKELDPKKYGIVARSGLKTGLLLPDLEGVDTIEKQILIACQKAGIEPAKEKLSLYRFTVQKYR